MERIIGKLNQVNFKKIEKINVGDAARIMLTDSVIPEGKWYRLLGNCFLSNYMEVNRKNQIEHLFFYSPEYAGRKEFRTLMLSIADNVNNSVIIEHKMAFSKKCLSSVAKTVVWYWQMRNIELLKAQKIALCQMMEKAYTACRYIEKLKKKNKIESITVLCDAHFVDNFICQFFEDDLVTIGLQHGIYADSNPVVMTNSASKKLLVYGEMTKKICVNFGVEPKKIVQVGMPHLIDREVAMETSVRKIENIGLIFNGDVLVEEDLKMLKILSEANKKLNKNLIVKLHPGTDESKYGDSIRQLGVETVYYMDIGIESFLEMIDVVVLYNSTVYIEALLKLTPVLIYQGEYDSILGDTQWCDFHDAEEFEEHISSMTQSIDLYVERMKCNRNVFTETENVKEKYKDFYNSITKVDL